jgi:hypothetical protein
MPLQSCKTAIAASLVLAMTSVHADSVRGNGDLPGSSGGDAAIFEAKHAWAWTESRNGKPMTLIYLFDREPPAKDWTDAEDRSTAITTWTLAAKAPSVRWELDDKNAADGIMVCNAEGMCSSRGVSVINDIPSARADIKATGGRISGKLLEGSGACGDAWCETLAAYEIDLTLAAPPLIDRVSAKGSASAADAPAARSALENYWMAAGKAKHSKDLLPFFSSERAADAQRQAERQGERGESMFKAMFVPAHSGKLVITDLKVLDQAAVASIKTRAGSGKDAWDLECRVLLRKQGDAWKIGNENC